MLLKGIVHLKMKFLSFTYPQLFPNLYEFLYTTEHKRRYSEESFGAPLTSIVGNKNTMEVNGAPELLCFPRSSEYLPLCSAEQRHSYRIGNTWGWVNDDRIFLFWWTIPLILCIILWPIFRILTWIFIKKLHLFPLNIINTFNIKWQ